MNIHQIATETETPIQPLTINKLPQCLDQQNNIKLPTTRMEIYSNPVANIRKPHFVGILFGGGAF